MKIAFGSDEQGPLTVAILEQLHALGHAVVTMLPENGSLPWPGVGQWVGQQVASGVADRGIVCCWTGTGVSIAANKVPGVRAALCGDSETARGARKWNDANVLALSLRSTTPAIGHEILEAWFNATASNDENDLSCSSQLNQLDRER